MRGLSPPVGGGDAGEPVLDAVLDGAALPAEALVVEVLPRRPRVGLEETVVGREQVLAEMHDRERDLVVLGEDRGVVDAAPIGRRWPRSALTRRLVAALNRAAVPVTTRHLPLRRSTSRW